MDASGHFQRSRVSERLMELETEVFEKQAMERARAAIRQIGKEVNGGRTGHVIDDSESRRGSSYPNDSTGSHPAPLPRPTRPACQHGLPIPHRPPGPANGLAPRLDPSTASRPLPLSPSSPPIVLPLVLAAKSGQKNSPPIYQNS